MPYSSVTVRPGVNSVTTPTLNQAGVSDSNLIRFRQGLIEKLGGWQRHIAISMGSTVRALMPWVDLKLVKRLAVGCVNALKVASAGGVVTDITPEYIETTAAINFSTTEGSRVVTIVDASLVGTLTPKYDAVFFNTTITVGGAIVNGLYQVASASAPGTYTINLRGDPATSTVANAGAKATFTTTADLRSVLVTLANHGLIEGEMAHFHMPTTVGGITIAGQYKVVSVTSTNVFEIYSADVAQSTDTKSQGAPVISSANARITYYIGSGRIVSTRYGGHILNTAAMGQEAIGGGPTGIITASGMTGDPIQTDDWSLDRWGEVLIANPRGYPIFIWDANIPLATAYCLGTGPGVSRGIFVAQPQQILVSWGSSASIVGNYNADDADPLLVRWSHVSDYTIWIPRSTNQAGSFRIPTGTQIMGAMQGPNQGIIWTDVDVYSMQYLGPPFVFGFQQIGQGCGLIGASAACSVQNQVFFMGENAFYTISSAGGVRSIPCAVWDTVFQDLDQGNKHKCVAGANSMFDEVFFFYPSITDGMGENSRYAKFNISEMVWDIGTIGRTAWIDQSSCGKPIGAEPDTYFLQEHEEGHNADGMPMTSFFETGYFAYGDGEEFAFVDHFEPDMKWRTTHGTPAQIDVTFKTQKWPNDSGHLENTLTMTSTSTYLAPRVRGRQMSLRIQSSDSDSWWRLGHCRYRWGQDGRN